jgi:CBS domain-containing membrane protein
MGASAMLLFAAPHSPMAQPWNLVGGHLFSAIAGLICLSFVNDPLLAAGASVAVAIFLMHYLNCLHPPGAATALMIVLNGPQFQSMGWKWALLVVIINTLLSLLLALSINNLLPGRKYPMQQMPQTPPKPSTPVALEQRDLEWALEQMDAVIDISEDDLSRIYELALRHAQERYDSAIKNK